MNKLLLGFYNMLFSFPMILNMYNLYVQLNPRSLDIFNLLSTLKEMVVSCFYKSQYMISRVGGLTWHPALVQINPGMCCPQLPYFL